MQEFTIDLPDINCSVRVNDNSTGNIRAFHIVVLDIQQNKEYTYYFKYLLQGSLHFNVLLQHTAYYDVVEYTKYKIIATNIIKSILREKGELDENNV